MEKLKTYSCVNKRFNAKGMVDYRLLLFATTYASVIYQILDLFKVDIINIIYILLLSYIPMFGIYFTVSKEENVGEVLINIFKYLIKSKIYIYKYEQRENSFGKYKSKYIKYSCKNK